MGIGEDRGNKGLERLVLAGSVGKGIMEHDLVINIRHDLAGKIVQGGVIEVMRSVYPEGLRARSYSPHPANPGKYTGDELEMPLIMHENLSTEGYEDAHLELQKREGSWEGKLHTGKIDRGVRRGSWSSSTDVKLREVSYECAEQDISPSPYLS